jgi:hypothetical protein
MDILDASLESGGVQPHHAFAISSTMALWDVRREDEARFVRVVRHLLRHRTATSARFRELVFEYFLARPVSPDAAGLLRDNLALVFESLAG